jgi:hypothetical protein
MRHKKRIYIVAKTYPTISGKYSELVCTAGVREDGSWIRLYPVPFILLIENAKYPKYTWVEVCAKRNESDFRIESYRPDISTMKVEPRPVKANWDERRKIVFKNKKAFTNLKELIDKVKYDNTSLALFKPTKILDFIVEEDERDWDTKKIAALQAQSRQYDLFKTMENIEEEFRLVKKVPYKFSYRFEDDEGKKSTLMIADWEIGMLYFNCVDMAKGNEKAAIANVRKKYFDCFIKGDIYFFLGTTKEFHKVAPNPFIVIGVFYPPIQSPNEQLDFNFGCHN